ncbi:MAG TPA: beta-galactosidase, partial [Clostridia bacterium]|nr:beta-galactosidase [Clostridia bacterium]
METQARRGAQPFSLFFHLAIRFSWMLPAFCLSASGAERSAGNRAWPEYRTILWMHDELWKDPARVPLVVERLSELGINTGMVHGDAQLEPLVTNRLPYYVENMVNRGLCLKWNSNVRDWDKFVTEWANSGRQESGLVRDYSLDDPKWRSWARGEMQQLVRKNREHKPVAYDIRDELSTTISANPFDYDFSESTLASFRTWLQNRYGNLEALNAGWETSFKSWSEVRPFTTDQIKNRMASG